MEVTVVLFILAVGSALVIPVVTHPGVADDTSLTAVTGTARDLAIRRTETLDLVVSDTGYRILGLDGTLVVEGALAGQRAGLEFRFSPLGTCLLLAGPPEARDNWDAVHCGFRAGEVR